MDIDAFKQQWQRAAPREEAALEGEAVMEMVRQQTTEISGRIRRRLRREASIYGGIAMGTAVATLDHPAAAQWTALAVVGGMLLAIIATLWTAERRIAAVAFDRSLRQSLDDLADRLRAAGRAYLGTYLAVCVAATLALAVLVAARQGAGVGLGLVVIGGAAATVWAYASGRAYVDRLFRRDRAALLQCVRQLDEV